MKDCLVKLLFQTILTPSGISQKQEHERNEAKVLALGVPDLNAENVTLALETKLTEQSSYIWLGILSNIFAKLPTTISIFKTNKFSIPQLQPLGTIKLVHPHLFRSQWILKFLAFQI